MLHMPLSTDPHATALAQNLLKAFDAINGPHPGYRPAHAKGILLSGVFKPSPDAKSITRAPHAQRESTPVTVRLSDSTGIPGIPDNDPRSSPRGFAVRFHLADRFHTDLISHSHDGFPAHTPAEFLGLLEAVKASGPDVPHPSPIEQFLGTHPAALAFVQAPKPFPVSFAQEKFFGVVALKYIAPDGKERFGRLRVRPKAGTQYLDEQAAAAKGPDFLMEEIAQRIAQGPTEFTLHLQIAGEGDPVDNATISWPADRPEVEFGTVSLSKVISNEDRESRRIIFDPIPRVDGIEDSGDPLLATRADVYLMSGKRRRNEDAEAAAHGA
jgi:catalase